MTTTPYLPDDPQARFREIYDALNAERRWWRHASPLRFAAVAALTCPGKPKTVATAIRRATESLRNEEGWFGRLDSSRPLKKYVGQAFQPVNPLWRT